MIVYIEDCLIENFLVTFLILFTMKKFFKLETTKQRIILASIIASVISVTYPLIQTNNIFLILFKLLVGILIVSIAVKGNNIIAKYLIFLLLTSIYAGLNFLIYYLAYGTFNVQDNFPTYILFFLIFLFYYLTNLIFTFLNKKLVISNFVFDVIIFNDKKEYKITAFLDSGNCLLDQDLTPVSIINFKTFSKMFSEIKFDDLLTKNFKHMKSPHYIKSNFAIGGSKMLTFKVDLIKILTNSKEIELHNASLGISYAKFNKNFKSDMLLNINSFI